MRGANSGGDGLRDVGCLRWLECSSARVRVLAYAGGFARVGGHVSVFEAVGVGPERRVDFACGERCTDLPGPEEVVLKIEFDTNLEKKSAHKMPYLECVHVSRGQLLQVLLGSVVPVTRIEPRITAPDTRTSVRGRSTIVAITAVRAAQVDYDRGIGGSMTSQE
jgi:hypothetical protein